MKYVGESLLLLVALGVLLLVARPGAMAGETRSQPVREWWIGRFRFQLPTTVDGTGRSQELSRVGVAVSPAPSEGVGPQWEEQLAALERLEPPCGIVGSEVRADGTRLAWSRKNSASPHILTVEALRPSGSVALSGTVQAEQGRESLATELLSTLLGSYSREARIGFFLEEGALTLEPSREETTRASFSWSGTADDELSLSFHTRTVAEPDSKTFADLAEEKAVGLAGGTWKAARTGRRVAAGLDGRERVITVSLPKEHAELVRYTWVFPGEAGSATHPMITVKASGPSARRATLDEAWEVLLDSLEPIPVMLTELEAERVARREMAAVLPPGAKAVVSVDGPDLVVTFPLASSGSRGADYHAQVRFRRSDGQITQRLVGS